MKKLFCLPFCVLLLLTGRGQSYDEQKLVDSLQRQLANTRSPGAQLPLLAQLSMKLSNNMPARALQFALQGIALSATAKDPADIGSCLGYAGWSYYQLGRSDSAKYYLNEAIALFGQERLYSREAKTLMNLSSIFQSEDKDQTALGYLLTADRLCDSSQDRLGKADAEIMIGINYRKQGLFDKAGRYADEAIAMLIGLKEDDTRDSYLTDAYGSKGNLYFALKKWDSVAISYKHCIQLSQKLGHKIQLAYEYESIADVFLARQEEHADPRYIDSALYSFRQAYAIFKGADSKANEAYEQFNIGKTLLLKGNYNAAKDQLTGALDFFKADKSYNYSYQIATRLSELYQRKGDYKQAFQYLSQSLVYKDSVDAAGQKKIVDDLLIGYETDKKDKTIQLLNAQKELANKQLSRNRLILLFSLGLTVLLVVIAVILRQRNRIRQQLKEVGMRNQIANDLHDDVGSSLSSILLFSKMAQEQRLSDPASILDKVGTITGEVIDRMSDIIWTMKPGNDEGISLKEKLEKLVMLIREASGINVTMEMSDKLDALKLNMHMRKNVFLICKEAMNNALKHAGATSIRFCVDIVGHTILVKIIDNGKGFDRGLVKKNNGTDTMLQRSKDCNGSCEIDSAPGRGTTVSIQIPIPHYRHRFS
jgi:two-component system, NarL family, sensor histidine kinase UhpB